MTSFDVAAVVCELNPKIRDARIENTYQISPTPLLLRLHKANQPTMQFLIEAGKRLHLTEYVLEKPLKPPAFCMTLRKHINRGIIENIEQYKFERIIALQISTKQGVMQLIVELFGEGNIILINQQNVIITALTFKKMRDRNILRNTTFQHAPESGKNPFQVTRTQMDVLRNSGQLEIVRALTRFLSIGGLYAEEVLLRANVDKNTPCQSLTDKQIDAIFAKLQAVLSLLRESTFSPVIVIDEKDAFVDAIPIVLERYQGLETKPHKNFNEALDEYYAQTSQAVRVSETQSEYEKELSKQQRMLQDQQNVLEDAKKAFAHNKSIGDLIYTRLGELQLLRQQISDAKQRGENWERIAEGLEEEKRKNQSPAIFFDSFDSKNMVLNVSIDGTVIPIHMTHSVQANAAIYYERMKKAERRLEGAERALQETEGRIRELQKQWTRKAAEAHAEAPPKRVKKAWYEKFRWFNSSDGFLVLGGRDATTNEILVKKHTEPHDIVFHAEIVGAPFVVVKTEGKSPTEQVVQEAAQFAASYSRAWREKLGAIDVYWVYPNQLSKTTPSGQYVERGAFIVRGTKNYIRKVPLRIAIGVQKRDEQLRIVGGPTEVIRKQTNMYAELVPGDEPSAKLAKKIRHLLLGRAAQEDREGISKIPVGEIQRFIPLGKGALFAAGK